MRPITADDIKTATHILAKAASYDPYFPKPDDAMAISWAEALTIHNLKPQHLAQAVTLFYVDNTEKRLTVGDVIKRARQLRATDAEKETEQDRDRRALANDMRLGLEPSIDPQRVLTSRAGGVKAIIAGDRPFGARPQEV